MKKYIWAVALALPWVCLVTWTLCLTYQRAHGTEVKVSITGYDPRDLLSGRYIAYQIDWKKTDCSQFPGSTCPKTPFCKEKRWGEQCRFYVPEQYADQLDKLFRSSRNDLHFEVIYSYRAGQMPFAKQLLINGTDWQEYIKTETDDHSAQKNLSQSSRKRAPYRHGPHHSAGE
jgi:hypothetical protein